VVTGVGSSERADPARGVSFTAAERVRLVRRNVALLVAAQSMAWTALPIFATVGPIAAFELSGHERSVGIIVALYGLAEAGGALIAGRVMDRLGRRVGLAAGYALLAVGGGGAAWSG
jgi:MFS family permease